MKPLSITLIATGGTIAKTYTNNAVVNQSLVIDQIIKSLRLPDLTIRFVECFRIDSADMTDKHRQKIAEEVQQVNQPDQAVIITHGTDTMVTTGQFLHRVYYVERHCSPLSCPVILTGAMLPYVVQGSDATQNLIESFLAARLMPPGIYIALHNRILSLPDVRKNYELEVFESTQL